MLLNTKSIKPMIKAKIKEATRTKIELLCNSLYLGQETLFFISSTESFTKAQAFFTIVLRFSSHGWRDSNSQPMVLETTTLPIELHP